MSTELVKVIEESGVEQSTATVLQESFLPFFTQAKEWKEKAATLIVTDASQVREMQMARQARLALKEIRVGADKKRKQLKEDSIRYGRAVQGVYNVIEYLITPIEEHLEHQEKFVQIQEAERRAELAASRQMDLQPFIEFAPPFTGSLGDLTDADWEFLLKSAKMMHQNHLEEQARIEAERIEAERKAEEERQRMIAENERLRKVAEAAEAARKAAEDKARKEREVAEAKAKAEREAAEKKAAAERAEIERKAAEERARVEAEKRVIEEQARKEREHVEAELAAERAKAAAKEAEEVARVKAEQDAIKKQAMAPDRNKLDKLKADLQAIRMPDLATKEAAEIVQNVRILIGKVVTYIDQKQTEL